MVMISDKELIQKARVVTGRRKVSPGFQYGDVGCALITDKNNVYVGCSIDTSCSLGFCAEHSAIAAMVTQGEHRIKKIVAIKDNGIIIPPCGRCRELMYQINGKNRDIVVIIGKNKKVFLRKLLPEPWFKNF
ncbi:MAG TPA: cytidine deaminase [bacterium]|nr:cytidine deaminase [bacterium]